MRIIPAIDLIDGKCVRLQKGDYSTSKVYGENPLEMAKEFEAHGLMDLHLVDLDGAKQKKVVNLKVLEEICTKTSLKVDFGGGIQSDEDLRKVLNAGANQVSVGSLAVKNKDKFTSWLEKFGGEKIILSADAKDEKIAVHGWQEKTDIDLTDFLKDYTSKGVQFATITDIDRDGMLSGASVNLYQKIKNTFPDLKLIASGGIGNIEDVKNLLPLEIHGVIIGKAIYEGRITLKELTEINE